MVFLQAALLAGVETGLTAPDVEGLVAEMDAHPVARATCLAEGASIGAPERHPLAWDGTRLRRTEAETGTVLSVAPTPSGVYARLDPCSAVRRGDRLAPVSVALAAHLDAAYGAGLGLLEPAPDLRASA